MVDLFGLKKESEPLFPTETAAGPQSLAGGEAALPPEGRHKLWAALLVVDAALVIVFGGALAAKLYEHLKAPPMVPAPQAVHRKLPPTPPSPTPAAPTPVPVAATPAAAPPPAPAKPAPTAVKTTGMVRKSHSSAVEFKLKAPHAKSVHLVGAFLVRDGGRKEMTYHGDGTWSLNLHLLPATSYRYWFVVDGRKAVDPENPRVERGASVLVLP
jgi:hypothetical protein